MPNPHKIHYDHRKFGQPTPRKIGYVTQKLDEDKVVKWLKQGRYIEDGYSYPRSPGDEDIMSPVMAKRMQVCGLVSIIGGVSEVFKERTITSGSAECIFDGREE